MKRHTLWFRNGRNDDTERNAEADDVFVSGEAAEAATATFEMNPVQIISVEKAIRLNNFSSTGRIVMTT